MDLSFRCKLRETMANLKGQAMANYHVSGNRIKGYNIKREGAKRISDSSSTREEAESEAKRLASNSGGGEVRIHGLDGKIRDSDTVPPANDPNPPKDSKH